MCKRASIMLANIDSYDMEHELYILKQKASDEQLYHIHALLNCGCNLHSNLLCIQLLPSKPFKISWQSYMTEFYHVPCGSPTTIIHVKKFMPSPLRI
ncbi:CLUMA_CG005470, isoform A [Clunio marinus]|uniref:CLUMA_CG005470, isoform A n=1 Tax=Clunio marinus TaxID=568069 RepID=A0A1J1I0D0_9DIPT|nr:CLUMA_CG005470, isoform A [Clunio marinus]